MSIDVSERMFLSDIRSSTSSAKELYLNALNNNKSNATRNIPTNIAKEVLESKHVFYFNADILNKLEERLKNAGDYIKVTSKDRLFYIDDLEPQGAYSGDSWISKEETIDNAQYKMNIDDLNTGENVGLIN